MAVEEFESELMSVVKTDHGQVVMLYAENICKMFGAHAIKIDPDGNLEALLISPEGSGWASVEDMQVVQTGRTRSSIRKQ